MAVFSLTILTDSKEARSLQHDTIKQVTHFDITGKLEPVFQPVLVSRLLPLQQQSQQ